MQRVKAGLGLLTTCFLMLVGVVGASDIAVKITPDLDGITLAHRGQPLRIQRDQDQAHTISPGFQRTSRKCPPFCLQPMHLPNGVETIGEIEMLDFLRRRAEGDDSILIIDSRGPNWVSQGTIPGALNLHYKRLSLRSANESEIADILERQFGASRTDKLWDFRNAKTLVMFCNGAWCGQSPANIGSLMRMGYPPSKLKWYRGGMQAWEVLGLTTVTNGSD